MKGQYEKAIADITRSIELDPSDPRVYSSRGRAYIGNQQGAQAIKDFRKAISMTSDPDVISKAKEILRELGEG
jgi:Flp pilus assembly protein TadD